jgi:hypothetical protein
MAWDDKKYIGVNTSSNGVSTSAVTSNADGSVLERLEYVQTVLGGGASGLRTIISESETVEENAIQYFNIGIFDVDAGAIALGSIDVTVISAVMEKSTGGGAFSASGITQPTFTKANGSVYCAYQFLAAQWTSGDMYKLVVSGITATIHSTVGYVPTAVWSNVVTELGDMDTNIEYIVGVVDDIHTDVGDLDSDLSAVAGVIADIHDTDLPDIKTDTSTILTDTEKIYDATFGVSPTSGSLASFIATGGTALGTVLPASTSLYDTVKNLSTVGITGAPVASTLADILHKDGSFTYDNTTDSLEAISDSISEGSLQIEADAGSTASVIIDAAALTQGTTDWWKGALLLSINGDNSGQARPIVSFNTTTDAVTVSPPFLAAPTAGDDFLVISGFKVPEWVPVAATAINATAVVTTGVDLLDLVDTDNKETYRLNNLRIKCANPGADTITISLYELINDTPTVVDTFTVTTDNYTTYFSLFDMFGLTHVAGDDITVNATTSAGSYAVTGNYQYDISYTA